MIDSFSHFLLSTKSRGAHKKKQQFISTLKLKILEPTLQIYQGKI